MTTPSSERDWLSDPLPASQDSGSAGQDASWIDPDRHHPVTDFAGSAPAVSHAPNMFDPPAPVVGPPARVSNPAETPASMRSVWQAATTSQSDFNDDLTPLSIPTQAATANQRSVRIGLWGSPSSGKSTFLAALPIAAAQNQNRFGRWRVAGQTPEASQYLVDSVRALVQNRHFPPATTEIEALSWAFHGDPPAGIRHRLRLPGRAAARPIEFTLQLQDAPGRLYQQGRVDARVLDHLAQSNGIIFLFDPIGAEADSYEYFHQTLEMLIARLGSAGLHRGRLPHRIAVCITKFDDEDFFRAAVANHWVVQEEGNSRLPSIPDEHAARFFDWVCDHLRHTGAPMVRDLLRASFHEDRIDYFVSTAIGFRLNRNNIFDFRDFRNTNTVGGLPQIREMPRPINVLEPLIVLERKLRTRGHG